MSRNTIKIMLSSKEKKPEFDENGMKTLNISKIEPSDLKTCLQKYKQDKKE